MAYAVPIGKLLSSKVMAWRTLYHEVKPGWQHNLVFIFTYILSLFYSWFAYYFEEIWVQEELKNNLKDMCQTSTRYTNSRQIFCKMF